MNIYKKEMNIQANSKLIICALSNKHFTITCCLASTPSSSNPKIARVWN